MRQQRHSELTRKPLSPQPSLMQDGWVSATPVTTRRPLDWCRCWQEQLGSGECEWPWEPQASAPHWKKKRTHIERDYFISSAKRLRAVSSTTPPQSPP